MFLYSYKINLNVSFLNPNGNITAVDSLSLSIKNRETVAIVDERHGAIPPAVKKATFKIVLLLFTEI